MRLDELTEVWRSSQRSVGAHRGQTELIEFRRSLQRSDGAHRGGQTEVREVRGTSQMAKGSHRVRGSSQRLNGAGGEQMELTEVRQTSQ